MIPDKKELESDTGVPSVVTMILADVGRTTGQRIRALRRVRETGARVQDLATAIGAATRTVRRLENDEADIRVSQVVPLATYLGVTPETVFGWWS